MKKPIFFILMYCLSLTASIAQDKRDATAIKAMCGCYEVKFEFGETFSPQKDYKFYENYQSSGLEWVELVTDEKGKIVLQHLLIVEDSLGKKSIVKHWRQDWLYENTDFYMFDKENHWRFVKLPKDKVKGQWTQKVFQVDDSPRYEGSATWVHLDGRHYWENTTDSPLPRREFTKRNDYNVLKRRNRHEIAEWGWLHEQDNEKIQRVDNQTDKLIAKEKGWDTYKKVAEARCQFARDWWKENQLFWAEVRQEWTKVYTQNKDLALEKTIDQKPLFMHLFPLKPQETASIRPILQKFIKK
ncbi:MAG: hypothetical protein MUE85_06345 [Microscillaceae bacterium]|jgi:hypothetical protein|nr:hypothetical protein [Microscillaceae bacterium]